MPGRTGLVRYSARHASDPPAPMRLGSLPTSQSTHEPCEPPHTPDHCKGFAKPLPRICRSAPYIHYSTYPGLQPRAAVWTVFFMSTNDPTVHAAGRFDTV